MTVRTRFAPSPTGDLHIGSARTALFAWAFARAHDGAFILRVEDTDRERHSEAAVAKIMQAMDWLGMHFDEGPYFQSEHAERYREVIETLLATGHAYRCVCSKERLDALREAQMKAGEKPKYDGCCRAANHGVDCGDHVIRFKTPAEGVVAFDDMVRGPIEVANAELDDLIIARTDGSATYNLTVVVDDLDMRISHVIRGDDHINNTPRQIHIFRALGTQEPVFGHVPSILAEDGKKLSKRRGAKSVMDYEQAGFLSVALVNYLIRLGWSHGDDEIFSREDIIRLFDMAHVQRSPSALNPDKLLWLNQHYLKEMDAVALAELLLPFYAQAQISAVDVNAVARVLPAFVERSKTLLDVVQQTVFMFRDDVVYDEKAVAKFLKPEVMSVLQVFHDTLLALSDWSKELIHGVIVDVCAQLDLKMGKLAQPVRVAVTGSTVSPSLDETLFLLGKDKSLERLSRVIGGAVMAQE